MILLIRFTCLSLIKYVHLSYTWQSIVGQFRLCSVNFYFLSSVRIKCRDLVKKIAIYRHRLAVSTVVVQYKCFVCLSFFILFNFTVCKLTSLLITCFMIFSRSGTITRQDCDL